MTGQAHTNASRRRGSERLTCDALKVGARAAAGVPLARALGLEAQQLHKRRLDARRAAEEDARRHGALKLQD